MLTLIILGAKSFRVINFVLVKNIIGNSSVIPTAYRETKRNDKELPSFNATFAELGTNAKHIDEIITSAIPRYFGGTYCIAQLSRQIYNLANTLSV